MPDLRIFSRRAMLRNGASSLIAGAILDRAALIERLLAQSPCSGAGPRGDLIGVARLHGERPFDTPYGHIVGGEGLDARRFTNLADLQPDRLITPTPQVFVRTTAPPGVGDRQRDWTIALVADARPTVSLRAADLIARARPMGAHLVECAGNSDPDNFGLMSVAEWDGVPLADAISALPRGQSTGVLVSGFDEHPPSQSSLAGASWVLPFDDVDRRGAFLAVRMNGEPLPLDHGAPVRLVNPGWYGCSWIKWVNEIRLVGNEAPATLQMREFSARTHQGGIPGLARDYTPPVIDLAAAPIRVEKRRVDGALQYRVVGIVWGGERPVDRLMIRFSARETPKPFTVCPAPRTHRTWSLWEYWWQPPRPGLYDIALKAADPAIPTRRLDISFYVRKVTIDEV